MLPILILSLALGLPADSPRPPNPLAPSLPQLTDEEEEQQDQVIDRFIAFDTGKLPGAEGRQALADFQKLGPEATFALIRGLNRAALIEGSCPAVIIAKKLNNILSASNDVELLDFARENMGVGVTRSRHLGVIKDLRVACMVRKSTVTRQGLAMATTPISKPPASLSTTDLAQAAVTTHGPKLKQVLTELEKRDGKQVITTLGGIAASPDRDAKQLARDLLDKHLSRQDNLIVKERLRDEKGEVRAAAARVAGIKKLRLGTDLIDRLEDEDADVREAARQALVQLSRGADYGPGRDASPTDRAEAVRHWREWWAGQDNR